MSATARRIRSSPAVRFLLVGGTTVLIDAGAYAALDALGVDYDLAKTISFITGAVFAYFANWRFTFSGRRSRWSEALFVLVYLAALVINIGLNGLVRSMNADSALVATLAFLVATGVSAVWNFAGMSLFVFRGGSSSQGQANRREVDAPTSTLPTYTVPPLSR